MSEGWKHVEKGMEVTLTCNVDSIPDAKVKIPKKYVSSTKKSSFFRLPGLTKEVYRFLHRRKSQLLKLSLGSS